MLNRRLRNAIIGQTAVRNATVRPDYAGIPIPLSDSATTSHPPLDRPSPPAPTAIHPNDYDADTEQRAPLPIGRAGASGSACVVGEAM